MDKTYLDKYIATSDETPRVIHPTKPLALFTAHAQLFGFFGTELARGMAHKPYLACRAYPL